MQYILIFLLALLTQQTLAAGANNSSSGSSSNAAQSSNEKESERSASQSRSNEISESDSKEDRQGREDSRTRSENQSRETTASQDFSVETTITLNSVFMKLAADLEYRATKNEFGVQGNALRICQLFNGRVATVGINHPAYYSSSLPLQRQLVDEFTAAKIEHCTRAYYNALKDASVMISRKRYSRFSDLKSDLEDFLISEVLGESFNQNVVLGVFDFSSAIDITLTERQHANSYGVDRWDMPFSFYLPTIALKSLSFRFGTLIAEPTNRYSKIRVGTIIYDPVSNSADFGSGRGYDKDALDGQRINLSLRMSEQESVAFRMESGRSRAITVSENKTQSVQEQSAIRKERSRRIALEQHRRLNKDATSNSNSTSASQ